MTPTELLEVGDEVSFKIDPEIRAWTSVYDTVPDGTKGVVCGFDYSVFYVPRVPAGEDDPGVYHRRGAVSVWLEDGRIIPGNRYVTMTDQDEERRRDVAMRGADGVLCVPQVRLGDLPETRFWELDKVQVRFPGATVSQMVVAGISYQNMHSTRDDGSPWPFYEVQYAGGRIHVMESELELIERGNLWRYYHGEKLVFTSLREEAGFFQLIGQTESVRNPANNSYSWTEEEVLKAIEDGLVHGFSVSPGLFGSGPHIDALCFRNKNLGARVADAILRGFDLPLA